MYDKKGQRKKRDKSGKYQKDSPMDEKISAETVMLSWNRGVQLIQAGMKNF